MTPNKCCFVCQNVAVGSWSGWLWGAARSAITDGMCCVSSTIGRRRWGRMCHNPWILTFLWHLSRQRELTGSVRRYQGVTRQKLGVTLLSEDVIVKRISDLYLITKDGVRPCGIRRTSAATWLLGSRVRILPIPAVWGEGLPPIACGV